MKEIRNYFNAFNDRLMRPMDERKVVLFCKALYTFFGIKVAFLHSSMSELTTYLPQEVHSLPGKILFAPFLFASNHNTLFAVVVEVLVVAGLLLRVNYITATLIWWFSFSVTRMMLPISNGSDQVLNLFLLLGILVAGWPWPRSEKIKSTTDMLSNFGVLLCQVQLALIYLLSGIDKLFSEAWRSGKAVYSISQLEFFTHSSLAISFGPVASMIIGWGVILFELAFAFLIWNKKMRLPLIIAGVIFHIGIVFLLSLPDFGLVMIVGYLICCLEL